MKFEIGKTYYGINPGPGTGWREFTVLAVIGEKGARQAAVKFINNHGEARLATWVDGDSNGHFLFFGGMDEYYQEAPPKPEFKVGDRIVIDHQWCTVSHYILKEEWTNARPTSDANRSEWIALRIYKNGTTGLAILSDGIVKRANPYKK